MEKRWILKGCSTGMKHWRTGGSTLYISEPNTGASEAKSAYSRHRLQQHGMQYYESPGSKNGDLRGCFDAHRQQSALGENLE